MPRAPRIEYAGGMYHVMSRGNRLGPIFKDEQDREILLKTLGDTCESAGWSVHSFAFMENHYHLLIETKRPTLVKGMQYLNATYTKRYNVRHKTFGHLFQGRYKALLVDPENGNYFLTVSDYIHMNPVRCGAVQEVDDLLKDRWNSSGWLSGKRKGRPEWLRWEKIYGELGLANWRIMSRRQFKDYLSRRMNELKELEFYWKSIRRGWCYGGGGFVEKMKERLEEMSKRPRNEESWNDPVMEEMEEERASRLMKQGINRLGYQSKEALIGKDRYLICKWLKQTTKVSVKWLADQMGLETRGGMSSSLYLISKEIEKNPKLARRWKLLYDNN